MEGQSNSESNLDCKPYEKIPYKTLLFRMGIVELNGSFLAYNHKCGYNYNSVRTVIAMLKKELSPKSFIYARTFEGVRIFRIL